ncbi:phosphate signaling complex protein PhoU [soil metagenome]|jgi:phosphate transport system protein|nr:phosphate signaling complex protein PhoU [Deinococcota bacterium]
MNALEQKLQELSGAVVRMLSFVRESTYLARRALLDGDAEAALRCAENDRRIDALQAQLEQTILTIIARRQPAAGDLRFLGAMYRALADIERAGDYAEHVARTGAELAFETPLKKYLDLARIFDILTGMIEATIKALAESSAEDARAALAMDDEIDELYEQVQRELLTYMMEDPQTIGKATKLLNVGRYLERLGDHLENVNEHIIFWLTGERL